MEPPAVFPLAECHPSILQRIIDLCDRQDLFLLRQVARRFREAVDRRVRRLRPRELPADLGSKFPGLVSLDLRHCSRLNVTARLGLLLPQLPLLRELLGLRLSDSDLPAAAEWLLNLGALTRLRFYNTTETGVFPAVAAHCDSLRLLEFHMCELDWGAVHSTVAQVAGTLTELDLAGPDLRPSGISEVCGALPHVGLLPLDTGRLRALSLKPKPADGIYSRLAALTGLSSLDLLNSELEGDGLAQLNALTQLTRLHLSDIGVSCADVARLTRLTRVLDLGLQFISGERGNGAAGLSAALAGFPGLTSLDISFPQGSGNLDIGDALTTLPGLTRLTSDGFNPLRYPETLCGLTKLQELRAQDSVANESQLRHLSALAELSHLDLLCTVTTQFALSEVGGRWLAGLQKLESLYLGGDCVVTPGALEQLARLPRLQELCLDVSPGALPLFSPLQRLPLTRLLFENVHDLDGLPPGLRVAAMRGYRFTWCNSKHPDDLDSWRGVQF